jgi:hypothetical protein
MLAQALHSMPRGFEIDVGDLPSDHRRVRFDDDPPIARLSNTPPDATEDTPAALDLATTGAPLHPPTEMQLVVLPSAQRPLSPDHETRVQLHAHSEQLTSHTHQLSLHNTEILQLRRDMDAMRTPGDDNPATLLSQVQTPRLGDDALSSASLARYELEFLTVATHEPNRHHFHPAFDIGTLWQTFAGDPRFGITAMVNPKHAAQNVRKAIISCLTFLLDTCSSSNMVSEEVLQQHGLLHKMQTSSLVIGLISGDRVSVIGELPSGYLDVILAAGTPAATLRHPAWVVIRSPKHPLLLGTVFLNQLNATFGCNTESGIATLEWTRIILPRAQGRSTAEHVREQMSIICGPGAESSRQESLPLLQ